MLQSSADEACNVLVKKVRYLKDVRKITKMMNGKLIYSWLKWPCGEFFSLNYKLTKRIYFISFIYNKG
ncbi:hypothetical protein [Escherichia coli]|uniref:hypothetical protein n=1 Tax=Escherichia coli TaxID=562 RepID=UPI00092D1784|nr:hypothetical protein [Escherichia coli]